MVVKLLKLSDNSDFSTIYTLYESKDFYFKTKRPESLYSGNINSLLVKDSDEIYQIYFNDNLEGLLSIKEDEVEKEALIMNIRLKNMDMILYNKDEFRKVLNKYIICYDIVKMRIFGFDNKGIEICEKLKFSIEAVLKSHIYKNNIYNDLLIYSRKVLGGDIFD